MKNQIFQVVFTCIIVSLLLSITQCNRTTDQPESRTSTSNNNFGWTLVDAGKLSYFTDSTIVNLIDSFKINGNNIVVDNILVGLAVELYDKRTKCMKVNLYDVREIVLREECPDTTCCDLVAAQINTVSTCKKVNSGGRCYCTKYVKIHSSKMLYAPLGEKVMRRTMDSIKHEYEFSANSKKLDFSYFTTSQIEPYLRKDVGFEHLAFSSCLIDYGAGSSIDSLLPKGKHFTLKVNPIDEDSNKEGFVEKLLSISAPPFQDGTPCPPIWEGQRNKSILRYISDAVKEEKLNR